MQAKNKNKQKARNVCYLVIELFLKVFILFRLCSRKMYAMMCKHVHCSKHTSCLMRSKGSHKIQSGFPSSTNVIAVPIPSYHKHTHHRLRDIKQKDTNLGVGHVFINKFRSSHEHRRRQRRRPWMRSGPNDIVAGCIRLCCFSPESSASVPKRRKHRRRRHSRD